MSTGRQVIMLGLDAADAEVIELLAERGDLPNLRRLRDAGRYGRLDTPADRFAGGVWPTFYTSSDVAHHGIFHNKLWRPEAMRVEVATDAWIAARPFWEALPDSVRACIIDVPMVLGAPRRLNGVYLGGWGTHDLISRGSWPPDLWSRCERKFGPPLMPPEHFGRQSADSLRRLPQQLIDATRQLTDIALDLLARERWDLACIAFSATHRAGHYLWDRSQLDGGSAGVEPHRDLHAVYREVDAAVGRIADSAAADALIIAFAVHGMGPNPGWSDLLPDIIRHYDRHASGESQPEGLLFRLKQRLPHHWVRPLLHRLPLTFTQRLVSLWSARMYDWSVTRAFPVPMDEAGYLRINLRGRERDGIVNPGREYEDVCSELEARLLSLRDEASGEPLAHHVVRAWAEAPEHAPGRDLLPDLVVPWRGPTAARTRTVVSSLLRDFRYDVPDVLPSGRAGNHTDRAWFVACGPPVTPGSAYALHSITDLVPTALQYLGVTVQLQGSPMDLSAAESPAAPSDGEDSS
jgi:predicted AlkP superfamily phosphohydrolase/phosphomutase